MNIFRLGGDLMHLASFVILLWKILSEKNVNGLSLKSQILYATVFVTRYLDLFIHFVSVYNTVMKIIFILTTFHIIFLIRYRFRATYDHKNDTFRVRFLVIPCIVAALLFHRSFGFLELCWSFSEWLEAIAILPQLSLLQRTGMAETLTAHYLVALGSYRGLYIMNWIYRYFWEGKANYISWAAGLLQTALYGDFFYHYVTKVVQGRKLVLPT